MLGLSDLMLPIVLHGLMISASITLVRQIYIIPYEFTNIFLDDVLFLNISVHIRTVTLTLLIIFVLAQANTDTEIIEVLKIEI